MMLTKRSRFTYKLTVFFLLLTAVQAFAEEPVNVGPGVTQHDIYRPEGPWAIHLVTVDLSQQYLELNAMLGGGERMGRKPLTGISASTTNGQKRPVAAINADFFSLAEGAYQNIPLGFHVHDGEIVTLPDPSRSTLYMLTNGSLGIDRFRPNVWLHGPDKLVYPIAGVNRPPSCSELVLFTPRFGVETRVDEGALHLALNNLSGPIKPNADITGRIESISQIKNKAIPVNGAVLAARGVAAYGLRNLKVGDEITLRMLIESDLTDIEETIGGGPRLVRNGQVAVEVREERFSSNFASRRHPRTGVGLRDESLVMVVVDGRQPGYSEGMTLHEFAQLFLELGCKEAMNLDGGGSTTMVVRDRLVNSPSGGRERPVVNALMLFSLAPVGPPVRLIIEPAEISVLVGEMVKLKIRGLDEYYNLVPVPPDSIVWECSSALGSIDAKGVLRPAQVTNRTAGLITARSEALTASALLRVLPSPARLAITPEQVSLSPGARQQFTVHAYDDENKLLPFSPDRVKWSFEPTTNGGAIDHLGVFKAPQTACRLTVKAQVCETKAEAEALVVGKPEVLESFEKPSAVSFHCNPANLPGETGVVADPLNNSNHCLRLRYDFSGAAETRVAGAMVNIPLNEVKVLSLKALGDQQGGWLRARLRDGVGRSFPVTLADRVDWSGKWRKLVAPLPEETTPPIMLESIYITEFHPDRKPVGEIYLDDIVVEIAGAITQPSAVLSQK